MGKPERERSIKKTRISHRLYTLYIHVIRTTTRETREQSITDLYFDIYIQIYDEGSFRLKKSNTFNFCCVCLVLDFFSKIFCNFMRMREKFEIYFVIKSNFALIEDLKYLINFKFSNFKCWNGFYRDFHEKSFCRSFCSNFSEFFPWEK